MSKIIGVKLNKEMKGGCPRQLFKTVHISDCRQCTHFEKFSVAGWLVCCGLEGSNKPTSDFERRQPTRWEILRSYGHDDRGVYLMLTEAEIGTLKGLKNAYDVIILTTKKIIQKSEERTRLERIEKARVIRNAQQADINAWFEANKINTDAGAESVIKWSEYVEPVSIWQKLGKIFGLKQVER